MKQIEVTLEEIKMATRPNVYRNKKKYNRKNKHKNDTESKTNMYNVLINLCKKAGLKILFKNNDGEAEIKLILTIDHS
jgi:hypothetical protein